MSTVATLIAGFIVVSAILNRRAIADAFNDWATLRKNRRYLREHNTFNRRRRNK